MRKPVLVALFALLPLPAMAADLPTETVIVDASTLTGVWTIARPSYVSKSGFFSAFKWGPMHDDFCRIGQAQNALTINCLRGNRDGAVQIDGSHFHIAWGTVMARMVLDGTLQSSMHFEGVNELKLAGLSFTDPEPSGGTKLKIDADAPDKAGKAALLRTILTDGMAQVPHDDSAIKPAALASGKIPQLGTLEALAYLGQETKYGPPGAHQDQVDYFSVYAVEFQGGERICGLHQRSDGVLDGFLCL